MTDKQVSREQIEQARQLDLLSYLQQYEPGELVKVSTGVYSTHSHDSLKISNGKWFRWSRGYGGVAALDYLIKVREMDFVSAVRYLCGKAGYVSPAPAYTSKPHMKKLFALPPANTSNDKVLQYLTARGIGKELLDLCVRTGRLYEDVHHNCVFVGLDQNKVPQYAMLRSSDTHSTFMREWDGSDKRYSFSISCPGRSTLYVFESAIDCLSFMELRRSNTRFGEPGSYLSLSGIYQPRENILETPLPLALAQFLRDNPQIRSIQLCLDHDAAGKLAAQTISILLSGKYDVRYLPPKYGKDYNEMLMQEKGLTGIRTRCAANPKKQVPER